MSYIYISIFFCYLHYALIFFKKKLVIFKIRVLFDLKMNEDDVCLTNCTTMHTILRNKRYFLELTLLKANVSTIYGTTNLVEDFGRANITLPIGTRFHINDALYSSKSIRNLLSFKDIRKNGYHIKTTNEDNI